MQTDFSPAQLIDPETAVAAAVIRKCVHCGFCTATCPTYVLLGDELDSPRGRIYLIKEMLETDADPTPDVVQHVDRCLSCLACMTTCPSGVNYMHLVDHARAYIEARYRRPWRERLLRAVLAAVLPYPGRFQLALRLARLARPLAPLGAAVLGPPVTAMLALAPASLPRAEPDAAPPPSPKRRVAILMGCAEPVLRPAIRAATVRLLARHGVAVVPVPGEGCCGALVHHLGKAAASLDAARRNVDAWDALSLDAIAVTASGCGTTIKDYGFMLRQDPAYAARAARVSALAKDISEVLADLPLAPVEGRGLRVAYHAACSLQHGQRLGALPRELLIRAGFDVATPAEAHLCCGSAGTYNLLQPVIAGQLRDRKLGHLAALGADVVATGNIGCMVQLRAGAGVPVVHTVELLDWATGGPLPEGLADSG